MGPPTGSLPYACGSLADSMHSYSTGFSRQELQGFALLSSEKRGDTRIPDPESDLCRSLHPFLYTNFLKYFCFQQCRIETLILCALQTAYYQLSNLHRLMVKVKSLPRMLGIGGWALRPEYLNSDSILPRLHTSTS